MIANHFKVSLESKPTIENLVYTVSLRFGCYAPDLIEPITATLYPLESRDRHGGPNPGIYIQFTPISKRGNTFQLESKTKVTRPIYAGLN